MRNPFLRSWLPVVAVALIAAGCGRKDDGKGPVAPAPPVAPFGAAPTEDEAREFGKKLEAAVADGDVAAVGSLLRIPDFVNRCVSDLDLTAADHKSIRRAIASGGGDQLAKNLIDDVENGGKFSLLRVRTKDGRARALMRHLTHDQGFNYMEITLARYPDGQVATEDVYYLATGEMLSQTLRRMVLRFLSERNQPAIAKLPASERPSMQYLEALQSIGRAVREERHRDAIDTYRRLPPELQKDKCVLLLTVRAVAQLDDQEHLGVLEDFRRHYPDEPAIDIVWIGNHLAKKQYDECLKCIERVDKAVGGDPYLLVMRGTTLSQAGRFDEARSAVEKAMEQDPDLEDAYWGRVTVALDEKDYPGALTWLKKLVERFDVELSEEELKETPDYALFLKSPQYKELMDWYKARKK